MSKISSDELSQQAYKKVKAMIMSKKLQPGQKIVQDKLAESLGISRTPLRSALQMLEAEYLVESVPRRGMMVKKYSDKEVIEIYDCRMALEEAAVKLFTENASHAQVAKIRKLFQPFLTQTPKIEVTAYKKADMEFHDSILQNCGNSFLYRLFQKGNLLFLIDIIGLIRPPEETLPEHMDIISAIEKKDANQAVIHTRNHLNLSRELIIKKIQD